MPQKSGFRTHNLSQTFASPFPASRGRFPKAFATDRNVCERFAWRSRTDMNGFRGLPPLVGKSKTGNLRHDARKGKLETGIAVRVGEGHPLVCIRNRGGWPVKPRQLRPYRLTQYSLLAFRECRPNWRDPESVECPRPDTQAHNSGRRGWHQGRLGGPMQLRPNLGMAWRVLLKAVREATSVFQGQQERISDGLSVTKRFSSLSCLIWRFL